MESPNKWQAIYILGQIYHSLGEAADAIREYRRVEDRFADAKESIALLPPQGDRAARGDHGQAGRAGRSGAEVPQRRRLRRQGLPHRPDEVQPAEAEPRRHHEINLAGIRPLHEATVKLGDGKDYRDRTHKLPLPLKEEGAYLVVCRGDDLHASGLVLVTPLAVEIQEDAVSGRVRTTVKDAADRPLRARRPRQGDRQPQRRFRLRRDRPARRVRGRRHPRAARR